MQKEIEQLLVLQDRDQKIRALKQAQNSLPAERGDLEQQLASSRAQLDAARQKAQTVELEKKKLEVEAQAKRDSVAKFKTQQFQTRKNEEFQALSNEIKRFEDDIRRIEDRELELMEEAERMKQMTSAAEKGFAQEKTRIETQLGHLQEKTAAMAAQLAELEAGRGALAGAVDEDLLDTYDRLFRSKHGLAVVALEHEVCTGCHMKITAQTAVRVKGERDIVSCEQCGRLLFFSE